MDMLAGKGMKLAELARTVGRDPDDLWALYSTATLKLARHFGTTPRDD